MNLCSRLASLVLAAAALLSASPLAHADSIVLASQSGNTFNYNLVLDSGSSYFSAGSVLSIAGLYGITSVTPGQYASYYGTTTFTGSSVTFTSNSSQSTTSPVTVAFFSLTSTSSTQGAGSFSVGETSKTYTGSVGGPVAPTPEPSSLLLLGSGLSVAAAVLRRRLL